MLLRDFSVSSLARALQQSILPPGSDARGEAQRLWNAACAQRAPSDSDDIIDFASFVYELFLDGTMDDARGEAGLAKIESLLGHFLSRDDLAEAMGDIRQSWMQRHEPATVEEAARWRADWRRSNPAAHRRRTVIWLVFAIAGGLAVCAWTLFIAMRDGGAASTTAVVVAAAQAAAVVAVVGGLLAVVLRRVRNEPQTEQEHFIA